jgi:hypothetical protein
MGMQIAMEKHPPRDSHVRSSGDLSGGCCVQPVTAGYRNQKAALCWVWLRPYASCHQGPRFPKRVR